MTLFVPVLLLFGFLTSLVRRGDDFPLFLSLVLIGMSLPSLVAAWRAKQRAVAPLAAMVVFGFCAWSLLAHAGVRFHIGPVALGGSLVLVLPWVAMGLGALSVAVGMAARYGRGRVFVAVMTMACVMLGGLVVSPALFALGVTSYSFSGIYYGMPLVQHVFWLVSGLVVGVLGAWQYGDNEEALPATALMGGMYVLAFATGVATGEHLWLPAILGLLLVQYGFHLRSHL